MKKIRIKDKEYILKIHHIKGTYYVELWDADGILYATSGDTEKEAITNVKVSVLKSTS